MYIDQSNQRWIHDIEGDHSKQADDKCTRTPSSNSKKCARLYVTLLWSHVLKTKQMETQEYKIDGSDLYHSRVSTKWILIQNQTKTPRPYFLTTFLISCLLFVLSTFQTDSRQHKRVYRFIHLIMHSFFKFKFYNIKNIPNTVIHICYKTRKLLKKQIYHVH